MSEKDHELDVENSLKPQPDPKASKKALFKLDCIFLPALTLIWFSNFLDRANIGNAKAAGLMEDLGINSTQYSIALTVTYVPYIVAESPLTSAIRKVGPNILIPISCISWGLVTTFQGFIHNYSGLIAARFFLGACEGAISPSSMTYLSTFYRRTDLGKRVAFYFSATSLAGAFSGLSAAGLSHMDGSSGKRGWQWIFIIEGLFTVVCGAATFMASPRTPETTWYSNDDEKTALVRALDIDRPKAQDEEPLTIRAISSALKAPQAWLMFSQFFSSGCMLFSIAYFAPTVVQGSGYKGTKIQSYSVPPYAASAFFALAMCYLSDRWGYRGPFIISAALISCAGYAMFSGSTNYNVLYGALFLQVIGTYTIAPIQSTWMPNNLAPFYRRVTGITMGFIATNSGGILSTWLFPAKDAHNHYRRGTSVLLGLSAAIVLWASSNMLYSGRENRRRARLGGKDTGGDDDLEAGDKSIHFRYSS